MHIHSIITRRYNDRHGSLDLVYEWEDILQRMLQAQMVSYYPPSSRLIQRTATRWPWTRSIWMPWRTSFFTELIARDKPYVPDGTNLPLMIVWIIDCYTRTPDQLHWLEHHHGRNKAVLISSREVYEELKKMGAKLRLAHFPLSLPDTYRVTPETRFEKKYDMVLMGRQNPVLYGFMKRYADEHPSFNYLEWRQEGSSRVYYDRFGNCMGDADTRERYWKLTRSSRISLYSTPGTDSEKPETNGYSQVTPRLLELMAAGNHIIARYVSNADTRWYGMENFLPSINTYEEFQERVDWCLSHEPDMQLYSDYLSKHYTSARIPMLKRILSNI